MVRPFRTYGYFLFLNYCPLPILLENIPACQSVVGFIVNPPFQAFETGEQGHWFDVKYGILPVSLCQVVIWDLRTQMMDMMEANIPAEPLQHRRQFIE